MRVIFNKFIPFKGYKAINLFGFLFARWGANINSRTINHESIHTAQMKEMLYIFFYLWYLMEFCTRLVLKHSWHSAYRAVSFEREAYLYEHDFSYLDHRKHYTWFKLIKTEKQ